MGAGEGAPDRRRQDQGLALECRTKKCPRFVLFSCGRITVLHSSRQNGSSGDPKSCCKSSSTSHLYVASCVKKTLIKMREHR
jgi:hypothetical protein